MGAWTVATYGWTFIVEKVDATVWPVGDLD